MSRLEVEVRACQEGDAEALLANLRPADLAEGEALAGAGQVPEMVAESLRASVLSWTAVAAGDVVCMFGVAPVTLMGDHGMPWMLGTPLVEQHRRALTRQGPAYIAHMLAAFPHLVNVVDARNVRSIAWLRRVGFQIHDARPAGVAGMPFHPFTMGI